MSTPHHPEDGPMTAHRTPVTSRKGVVATANYGSSMAGLRMLLKGGNAVDAAVAAAAALNVVEPYMSGMGGVGLLVLSRGFGQERRVLNFTGRTPGAAVPEAFTVESRAEGVRAPLVPGNPAGWLTLHQEYGSLGLQEVLAPATELAAEGTVLSELNSRFFAVNREKLGRYPTSRDAFIHNGSPPVDGEVLRQPALAGSFERVARGGLDAFYRGEIAEEVARFMKAEDGLIDQDDLGTYEPRWDTPIGIDYRDYHVVTTGPNSVGFQILETLNMLEGFDLAGMGHNSADYIHLLTEAIKLAATDRIAYGGDPDYLEIPLDGLLSKEYAGEQRGRIDHRQASVVMGERHNDNPPPKAIVAGNAAIYTRGETTHMAAADSDGTVVTLTQTIGGAFGSGVVAGSTGILMNNLIDWMEIDPASTSRFLVAPRRRPATNMSPVQVFKDGVRLLSIGTPGSFGITQTTMQMLLNVLEFGMNVQEAIEAPRFRVMDGVTVNMESRVPEDTVAELAARGHDVQLYGEWSMGVGGGHGISFDPDTGVMAGGADPRRGGYALGA